MESVNCISCVKVEAPFFLNWAVKVFLEMCFDRAVEMNSPLFHVLFTVIYVMHELQIVSLLISRVCAVEMFVHGVYSF